jgi:hypothetical protein
MSANGQETNLLAKIPPLALTRESPPFDKGVNPGPARLAINAIPGNR